MAPTRGHLGIPADLTEEVWSRLSAAGGSETHPMRLMVLCTVEAPDRPAGRTMVVRGFDPARPALLFHTDARSRKVEQLRGRPGACVIAYDPRDGVQLRMDGAADIHDRDALADDEWRLMDEVVRYAYALSEGPGRPMGEDDPHSPSERHRFRTLKSADGREHFAVVEFVFDSVEWFQTTSHGQSRAVLKRADGWRPVRLAV